MIIRKVLSLLLALVFAVSLVSVLPVSAGAAEKLDTPEGRWDGTTIEWTGVDNVDWYLVTLWSDPNDGIHANSRLMELVVKPKEDGTLELTERLGHNNPKGNAWDGYDSFALDVSNYIQIPSDFYFFDVSAHSYNTSAYSSSDMFFSEHVQGRKLKSGYITPGPHTVTVTNGTADPSEALAGETVTITVYVQGDNGYEEKDLELTLGLRSEYIRHTR